MRAMPLLLGSVLLFALACDSDPDERTLLTGPRLLAIQASPPAFRGSEGAVRLSALAIDEAGRGGAGTEVRYRVCSPWQFLIDPERDCPASKAFLLSGNEVSADELLRFYPPPSPGGGDDAPDDPLDGSACAPQTLVEVPIIAEVTIDHVALQTVKRIPVYAQEVDRKNPKMEEIEVSDLGDGQYQLTIRIDPASLDLECRDGASVPEAVRVFLYSTSGSFEQISVDLVPTLASEAEPAEVLWSASADSATLYFVAIDNDGGVDWQSLTLTP